MEPIAPIPAPAEPALQPGDALDRYRVVRELGRGGMGTIYLARDTVLRRMVALKVLPQSFVTLREHRERFMREAQAAAKIRHPNVVAVHDVCMASPPYIVMEYLAGETFEALLRREAPMAFDHALEVLLPVMSAVLAAHESRVIHRDLKPANIMLTRERDGTRTPKVLDFGISKMAEATREPHAAIPCDLELTRHDAQLGTPNYMAPEQDGAHDEVGPWSDVYPLALMLYRAVTGRLPFVGASAQEVLIRKRHGAFAPVHTFPFGLPAELDAWMTTALAPDPRRRFPSIREAATALLGLTHEPLRARWMPVFAPPEDAHDELTAPQHDAHTEGPLISTIELAPVPQSSPALGRISRRERALVIALAVVSLATAALGIWAWQHQAPRLSVLHPRVRRAPPATTAPSSTPRVTSAPPSEPPPLETPVETLVETSVGAPPGVPVRAHPATAPRFAGSGNVRPRPATIPLGQGEWVTTPQLGGSR